MILSALDIEQRLRINPFFQISIRCTMTSRPIPSSFPENLRKALELRSQENVCPAEIRTHLQSISFFQAKANPPQTTRFQTITNAGHLKSSSVSHNPAHPVHHGAGRNDPIPRRFHGAAPVSQWRPQASRDHRDSHDHRDSRDHRDNRGFARSERDSSTRGGPGHALRGQAERGPALRNPRQEIPGTWTGVHRTEKEKDKDKNGLKNVSSVLSGENQPSTEAQAELHSEQVSNHFVDTPSVNPVESSVKFSSAAVKSSVDTDDRILAKVKGKINKIGFTTYEATKTFMQQILDSDETEFLDEFMKFVFQKAATESTFCPLYAKLLHELADQFTHLRVVMHNLFRDYTAIFTEVETAPDVGTEDYKAFLEAQERKKFRRGYSQFVAELVKMGEADEEAFSILVQQIVSVLEASNNAPAKTLVCEEYIDCLAHMCTSAPKILSGASWSVGVKARLIALTELPRSTTPGLTNKGRFALMDLVDFAKRGWK
jgi:hypothetical protein